MLSWRFQLQFRGSFPIQQIAGKSLWLRVFSDFPQQLSLKKRTFSGLDHRALVIQQKSVPGLALPFGRMETSGHSARSWAWARIAPAPLQPPRSAGPTGSPAAQLALGCLCTSSLRAGHRTSFCLLRPMQCSGLAVRAWLPYVGAPPVRLSTPPPVGPGCCAYASALPYVSSA